MEPENEEDIKRYPSIISYESTKKILHQMEKYICEIQIDSIQGTGFFCKIPFPDDNMYDTLPVLITSSHIINSELLDKKDSKISIKTHKNISFKSLNLNDRKKYINKDYDITIIEIKAQDNIKNYLKINDNIINDVLDEVDNININPNETIYMIQYPKGELSVSYGTLDNIDENKNYIFNHKCCAKNGSLGSPILNMNNEVIGMHIDGSKNIYNQGLILFYAIKDFIEKYDYKFYGKFNKKSKNKNNKLLEKFIRKYNFKYLIYDFNLHRYYHYYKDTAISLNLSGLWIINQEFDDLSKIHFKEIKKLYLGINNISNITPLENMAHNQLEILDLSKNRIKDISVLEKVKFNELKELYLSGNNISDIKVLEKVKFENLEILDLADNKISDINILEKVNFKELKDLYLNLNIIVDLKVFEKTIFEKLEKLFLNKNKIDEKENALIISKLKDTINEFMI